MTIVTATGMVAVSGRECVKSLHNLSEELACEKVDLLKENTKSEFEFWGRKPACATMECSACGFGKPNGTLPTARLETARQADWWGGCASRTKQWKTASTWRARKVAASSPQHVHGDFLQRHAVNRNELHRSSSTKLAPLSRALLRPRRP